VRLRGLFRRKKNLDSNVNNNGVKDVQQLLQELDVELGDIIVDIIRRASERPAVWWQWLMLIIVGILGGIGIGILISNLTLPRQVIVPPQNITIHF
jgi:hypothetical protein